MFFKCQILFSVESRHVKCMGRTGAAHEKVKGETGCPKKDVRHSTIVCGLKHTAKDCYKEWLLPILRDVSEKSGMFSYVVSLVANAYVIRNPSAEIASWQTFYNQMWTAVERGKNDYTPFVTDLLDAIAESEGVHTDAMRQRIGEKLQSFEYRQNETAQMKRSASLHFELFRSRLNCYLRTRVIVAQLQHMNRPVIEDRVFRKVVDAVLGDSDTEAVRMSSLETVFTKALGNDCEPAVVSAMVAVLKKIVTEERRLLGNLLEYAIPGTQSWYDATKTEKRHYLLLPHLQRYSNYSLAWWDQHKETSDWHPIWKDGKNRPTCFSLLPICQLRPRMVHYSWTQLEQVFKAMPQNPLFDAQQATEKELVTLQRQQKQIENPSKKRKRSVAEVETCEEIKANLLADIANKQAALHKQRIDARIDLMTELFDLKKLKGKYRKASDAVVPDWRVCEFATDGVQLSLTFISGRIASAPNVTALVKQGYAIPVPVVPINVWDQKRGVYHIKEGVAAKDLIDTESAEQCSEHIELVPVDPGCLKPIQSARILLSECQSVSSIAEATARTAWHITEDQWKHESGRGMLERIETRRRQESERYASAIEALRRQRKKCADDATFTKYCETAFKHLDALAQDLLCLGRSKIRWARCRRSIGFISRIADRLFNRETLRFKRAVARLPESEKGSPANRANLKAALEKKRSERCGNKIIVLFGDGMFSHQKKHIPIPKKAIVKTLASRGLTFLVDEFNTSKMCPCGQSELCDIDTSEGARLRCHKATGPESCCVLDAIGQSNMERDILAAANICHCGACAFQKKNRPPWLCRLDD